MTILLRWLVDNAWIFYAGCVIGVIVYFIRALTALRERNLAMFTLERETATSRLIQAWVMIFVFIAIGALIFASANYLLPDLPDLGRDAPRPTPTSVAGVDMPTPVPTSSPTEDVRVATATPAPAAEEPAPLPPEEPTLPPTPEPTATLEAAVTGEVHVRFGEFAELVGFSLPTSDVTAAEPLQLVLYWQALDGTSPVDYTVFTHLLAEDGRLIAQHDSVPAYGVRPTSSWVPGERIVDGHAMSFQDVGYTGPARLLVGLYDPASGRVLTDAGSDHVVLPIAINVMP